MVVFGILAVVCGILIVTSAARQRRVLGARATIALVAVLVLGATGFGAAQPAVAVSHASQDCDAVPPTPTPPVIAVDLTPVITINQGVVDGPRTVTGEVRISNLTAAASGSPIVFRIPKGTPLSNPTAPSAGLTIDTVSDPGNFVFTYTTPVPALTTASTTFSIDFDGVTSGQKIISVTLDSGTGNDSNTLNNFDQEIIQYFAD